VLKKDCTIRMGWELGVVDGKTGKTIRAVTIHGKGKEVERI